MTVLLQGLPPEASSDDLREALRPFAPLHIVRLVHRTGGPGDVAFLIFDGYADASDAVRQLDGQDLLGRPVRLSYRFTSVRDATWS